jgi:hypothetical protein
LSFPASAFAKATNSGSVFTDTALLTMNNSGFLPTIAIGERSRSESYGMTAVVAGNTV